MIRQTLVLFILIWVFCLAGCVKRTLTLTSDPPGATILLDGQEIGQTPFTTDFVFYGTREVTIQKAGYQTLRFQATLKAPWYELVPVDFITENLLPTTLHVKKSFHVTLTPQKAIPPDLLIQQAQAFKKRYVPAQIPVPQPPHPRHYTKGN